MSRPQSQTPQAQPAQSRSRRIAEIVKQLSARRSELSTEDQAYLDQLQQQYPAPDLPPSGVPEIEMQRSPAPGVADLLFGAPVEAARQGLNLAKGLFEMGREAAEIAYTGDAARGLDFAKGLVTGPFQLAAEEGERLATDPYHPDPTNRGFLDVAVNSIFAGLGGDPARASELDAAGRPIAGWMARAGIPVAGALVGSRATRPGTRRPMTSSREISALAEVAKPDPRYGMTSTQVAADVQPLLRQVASDWGLAPGQESLFRRATGQTSAFPSRNPLQVSGSGVSTVRRSPVTEIGTVPDDIYTNVSRGASPEVLDQLAERLGKPASEIDHIGVEMAREASRLADNTVQQVISAYADQPVTPSVRRQVLDKMEESAQYFDRADAQGTSAAIRRHMDAVREAVTLGDLNELKVFANKQLTDLYNAVTPGDVIGMDARQSMAAWRDYGQALRSGLYPEIERLGGEALRPYLSRESSAIAFRDGVFDNYYKSVEPPEAAHRAQRYLEQVVSPEVGGQSYWLTHVMARAAQRFRSPTGQFNLMFRRGLGEVGQGAVMETVQQIASDRLLPAPKRADLPEFQFTIQGTLPDEIRYGTAVQDAERLYNPDRVVLEPNPNFDPMVGPDYGVLAAVDDRLPSRYQPKPQPPSPSRQRANELGPTGSTVPDRLFTGPEDITTRVERWDFTSTPLEPGGFDRPAGGGVLRTSDPAVVAATIDSITEMLNEGVFPMDKKLALQKMHNSLVDQLDYYYSVNAGVQPMGVPVTRVRPGSPGTVVSSPTLSRPTVRGGAGAVGTGAIMSQGEEQ